MNRRTSTRAKVDILINRFVGGHPYMCRMTDISPTGLRIVPLLEPLLEPRRSARFMGLQFQLPGEVRVFTASGEAVNGVHGDTGFGIRFTSLPPECARAIDRFVGDVAAA
jgi:hypothetical protein